MAAGRAIIRAGGAGSTEKWPAPIFSRFMGPSTSLAGERACRHEEIDSNCFCCCYRRPMASQPMARVTLSIRHRRWPGCVEIASGLVKGLMCGAGGGASASRNPLGLPLHLALICPTHSRFNLTKTPSQFPPSAVTGRTYAHASQWNPSTCRLALCSQKTCGARRTKKTAATAAAARRCPPPCSRAEPWASTKSEQRKRCC